MPACLYLTSASFSLRCPTSPVFSRRTSSHLIARPGPWDPFLNRACRLQITRVCDVLPSCGTGAHTHSGLLSFASTTLVLSLVNAQSTGVHTPNVVVGMALFVGGLAQLLAGMWEFAAGNTFGATGE